MSSLFNADIHNRDVEIDAYRQRLFDYLTCPNKYDERAKRLEALRKLLMTQCKKVSPNAHASNKKTYVFFSAVGMKMIFPNPNDTYNKYKIFSNVSYLYAEEGWTDRIMWSWMPNNRGWSRSWDGTVGWYIVPEQLSKILFGLFDEYWANPNYPKNID